MKNSFLFLVCLAIQSFAFTSAPEIVGFGTYPLEGKTCTWAVEQALENGYQMIDTATFYQNFEAIGEALKKYDREDCYLISKVWPDKHSPADLQKDLEFTLDQLQTDYLDAYLLHWPNSTIPIEETLYAMDALKQKGKIRSIGLSNVTIHHLKRALEVGVPISWVQVEMNPFFYDEELLAFCVKKSIAIQAWAPLARGQVIQDPLLTKIGQKYGKTPSQIAIKWIVQHGCIPLPSSQDERHIRENTEITDFALTDEEMAEIDQRAKTGERQRLNKDLIGFADEFDFSYEECWPKWN